MLRRTKATVEANVPPKEEQTVFIPLTEAQRFWYYRLLTRMDTMDLQQIFKAEEGENMDEGRQEVLSHLANQMKGQRANRTLTLVLSSSGFCSHSLQTTRSS